MGATLERGAIRPVMRHALSLSWVLSTVAVSIILKNAAVNLWGPEQIKFPPPFGEAVLQIGSAGIFPQELFIIVAALGTVFAVQMFLRRSLLGIVGHFRIRVKHPSIFAVSGNSLPFQVIDVLGEGRRAEAAALVTHDARLHHHAAGVRPQLDGDRSSPAAAEPGAAPALT